MNRDNSHATRFSSRLSFLLHAMDAKLDTNDIDEWVGEVCDQFDERWQAGCFPNVEDVLPPNAEEQGALLAMLRELLAIDMEYRWREFFRAEAVAPKQRATSRRRRPWLEDYVRRFPVLTTSPSTVVQLLKSEFRTRQVWGDRPSLVTYAKRFPKLGKSLLAALHEVLAQIVTSEIKVFTDETLRFSAPVTRPVVLGRQRKNEPKPIWMDQDDDVDRLVIARADDRSTSREHVRLELVAVDRLLIVNHSELLETTLGNDTILPGQVHHTCPPASISIGSSVVRFITVSKIRNLEIHSRSESHH